MLPESRALCWLLGFTHYLEHARSLDSRRQVSEAMMLLVLCLGLLLSLLKIKWCDLARVIIFRTSQNNSATLTLVCRNWSK